MEFQRAYAAIKTIQAKIQSCDEEEKRTDGDVKAAFSTVKAYYKSKHDVFNLQLQDAISKLLAKKEAQNNISGNEYIEDGKGRARC
jgi:DNA-binding transcriptional regulator GbsR (MarR family)